MSRWDTRLRCLKLVPTAILSDESGDLARLKQMAMIVRGFIEPIARELPMEYALELNRLIELQMEGSVG